MVFADPTFLLYFLPIHIILYFLWDNKTYRNVLLTAFSLIFYAWGEPIWVALLVFSATLDYANGRWIEHFRGRPYAKWGLWSSVTINLGLLALFKYNRFIYENVHALTGWEFEVPEYSLPVGISFYTFQTISYTIDVYRGTVPAQRSYLRFLMFVSLFHQLVAGPIVRYTDIAKEIDHRVHRAYDINQGIFRFCIGFFKKVFIADVAGEIARQYLDGSLMGLAVGEAWVGLLLFSIQIYFDFSGYSDMAIGLGRIFGFHYQENFRYPYIARSASDFWRRWHISLGSFFRDYLYIPLGGNRRYLWRNLFVVWFLTGLWHGASWNFVFWGLYFGLLIALERLFLQRVLEALPRFVSHAYLLFMVVLGWGLFYFEDFGRLSTFFGVLFGYTEQPLWRPELSVQLLEHLYWLLLALLLCLPIYPYFARWWEGSIRHKYPLGYNLGTTALQIGLLLLGMAMVAGNTFQAFIYFRF